MQMDFFKSDDIGHIGLQESSSIEFKETFDPKMVKEVIAFANTAGGSIYIGIDDKGIVIGLEDIDATMLQINNTLRDSVDPDLMPFVTTDIKSHAGLSYIHIKVLEGSRKPYYLKSKGLKEGGVFTRQGSASVPCTSEAIRSLIRDSDNISFEALESKEQDLSFTTIEPHFRDMNLELGCQQMQTLGFTNNGVYTNLALILSEQNPYTIKIAVFSGEDKMSFINRKECTGSLFHQIDQALEFLDLNNRLKATFESVRRKDTRDYDSVVLREAVLNAVIHRDYAFPGDTIINIFSNRLEIISLGGLVSTLTIADILLGASVHRNTRLAHVFYRLRYVESLGLGRVMEAYNGFECKPIIECPSGVFKLTIFNKNNV